MSFFAGPANCTYVLRGPWANDAQSQDKSAFVAFLRRSAEQLNRDAASIASLASQVEQSE